MKYLRRKITYKLDNDFGDKVFVNIGIHYELHNATMSKFVIKNLPDLLSDYLGPKKVIVNSDLTMLNKPGDNYGSIMLKLDLTLNNVMTGENEMLYAVAKTLPEGKEVREVFNVDATCRHEAAVYTVMVPTLRAFQQEVGVKDLIDWSPDVYGARTNLTGSDIVDENACLVLENLKIAGFTNIDRSIGFDLETTKVVLKSLASFHAVPVALKLRKPKVFEEKLNTFYGQISLPEELFEFVRAVLDQNEKFKNEFINIELWPKKRMAREPYATITHCDLWVNNTMQKFENGKPVANKIIDFQCIEYGSPAADVYFFLFTSVQKSVLEKHLDELLEYYHENFVGILEAHGCDKTPFSYEAFLDEIKIEGRYEFGHTLLFSTLVRQTEESKKETSGPVPLTLEMMMNTLSESGRDHFYYIAEVCLQRGWY